MGRYRKIDDNYDTDEKTMSLSFEGDLAFMRILTTPSLTPVGMIKGTIKSFAYSFLYKGERYVERLEKGLRELLEKQLIHCSANAPLIIIPNFVKYNLPENQNAIKAWASSVEQLPKCEELYQQLKKIRDILTEHASEKPWVLGAFDSSFNGWLNSSSNCSSNRSCNSKPNQITNNKEQITNKKENIKDKSFIKKPKKTKKKIEDTRFDEWYSIYPKKVERKKAEQAYLKIVNEGQDEQELVEGAKRYAKHCADKQVEKQFIKYPASWLNAGCWTDELEDIKTNPQSPSTSSDDYRPCGGFIEAKPFNWEEELERLNREEALDG